MGEGLNLVWTEIIREQEGNLLEDFDDWNTLKMTDCPCCDSNFVVDAPLQPRSFGTLTVSVRNGHLVCEVADASEMCQRQQAAYEILEMT